MKRSFFIFYIVFFFFSQKFSHNNNHNKRLAPQSVYAVSGCEGLSFESIIIIHLALKGHFPPCSSKLDLHPRSLVFFFC